MGNIIFPEQLRGTGIDGLSNPHVDLTMPWCGCGCGCDCGFYNHDACNADCRDANNGQEDSGIAFQYVQRNWVAGLPSNDLSSGTKYGVSESCNVAGYGAPVAGLACTIIAWNVNE